MIDKKVLLKLLKKSMLYRLMDNLDRLVITAKLTHREVSYRTGNSHSWFNDAYNNNEDIRISSFIKVLSVLKQEIESLSNPEINFHQEFINLFDDNILKIATMIGEFSDEEEREIAYFTQFDKGFFNEIIVDWVSMRNTNKLDDEETRVVNQVIDLIAEEDI